MFLIYQPEDGQWKGPKHVVVLYVINYTYLYHHIVVLDKYRNSNLLYYKHKEDDEPYDYKHRNCNAQHNVTEQPKNKSSKALHSLQSQNTIIL